MASNIRVVLEVDNKKYLADVKAAERATDQFATNTVRNTNKVDGALNNLGRQFGRLRTVIAGLALGALGRSLLQLADEMQDLSNASGLATGRIIELRNAIAQAGGSPQDAATALTRFAQAIDDAAGGSINAQNKLIELGISMQDLRRLSDEDLFMRTLEQLAAMEAGARRTALMVEYFGKSFKTVDPKQLLDELRQTRGEGDAYAKSVKQAAALNDSLQKSFSNLQMSLLIGFEPMITQLAEFTRNISISREQIETVVSTVKALAAAVAGLGAIAGLLLFVRYIGVLGRGIGAAIKLFEGFAAPAAAAAASTARTAASAATLGARISGMFAAFAPVLTAARALAVIVGTGFGIYAATQLFDDFGDIAVNAISRIVEALGELTASTLNLPTDALASFLNVFLPENFKIKDAIGLGTPFKIAAEQARKAREEVERLRRAEIAGQRAGAGRGNAQAMNITPGEGVAVATGNGVLGSFSTTEGQAREVDETARSNAIKQIRQIGEELAKNLQKRRQQIGIETQAIGLSEDLAEALKLQADVNNDISSTIDQLIQKRDTLGKEEQYLIPTINQQIKALEQRRDVEVSSTLAALQVKQVKAAADRIEIQNSKQLNDLESLRAQLLGYSLTEYEKFIQAQRAGDFRGKTADEIEQLADQALARDELTQKLTVENTIRATTNKLLELETGILGRQFSEVEKLEQLKAQNPEAFARKTQAETDALMAQARALDEATAKYNSLAFARDLARQGEDFAAGIREQLQLDRAAGESARRRIQVEIDGRNQLNSRLREIQDRYGDEMRLSDEMRQRKQREVADAIAGITAQVEARKQLVAADQAQRETFEFGWESAFNKYAEDANNAANQAKTYFDTFTRGFEDAIVRFVQTGKFSFKDLANSIIADFARIAAKRLVTGIFDSMGGGGGSIFSSIGKIFGFADGGNPAIGKPILVGERGPELMIPRNASTIVPNNALGGSSQQVSVTYNIQAVDASSFRTLVARDPEFIYNVTEQGRKGLPGQHRRR